MPSSINTEANAVKRFILFALFLSLLLLPGCRRETSFSLEDGRYVPEETGADGIAVPYLLLQDGRLAVIQKIAVSYQPSGTVTKDGNKIVMETIYANEPYKWTFILTDDNTLRFSAAKSSIPLRPEDWKDGMKFVLAEEEG